MVHGILIELQSFVKTFDELRARRDDHFRDPCLHVLRAQTNTARRNADKGNSFLRDPMIESAGAEARCLSRLLDCPQKLVAVHRVTPVYVHRRFQRASARVTSAFTGVGSRNLDGLLTETCRRKRSSSSKLPSSARALRKMISEFRNCLLR